MYIGVEMKWCIYKCTITHSGDEGTITFVTQKRIFFYTRRELK